MPENAIVSAVITIEPPLERSPADVFRAEPALWPNSCTGAACGSVSTSRGHPASPSTLLA